MKKCKIESQYKVGGLEEFAWFIIDVMAGVIFDIYFAFYDAKNHFKDIPMRGKLIIKKFFVAIFFVFYFFFFWLLSYFPRLERIFRPEIRIFYPE